MTSCIWCAAGRVRNCRWRSTIAGSLPTHQGFAAIRAGGIGRPIAGYARKNDTIYVSTEMINWAAQSTPIHFLGAHDIDLMRWYFGSEPLEVRAYGAKGCSRNAESIPTILIQAQVKFESEAFATFEAAWIYPNTFPTIDRLVCRSHRQLRATCISIASASRSR